MADELSIGLRIQFQKTGATGLRIPMKDGIAEHKYDVSGTYMLAKEQPIGTSPELITGGEVGENGYIYLENLDDTNYVSLLGDNDGEVIRLNAGDIALFRAGSNFNVSGSYSLQANTAECNVMIAWIPS